MNPKDLEAFAREAAKHMKTEKDLRDFTRMLTKVTVETASTVSWMLTSVMRNTRNPLPPIVAMAIRQKR